MAMNWLLWISMETSKEQAMNLLCFSAAILNRRGVVWDWMGFGICSIVKWFPIFHSIYALNPNPILHSSKHLEVRRGNADENKEGVVECVSM